MTLKFYNTAKKLPPYRKDVLFWYPIAKRGEWRVGRLWQGEDRYGDYFLPDGGGAWYLFDGHTVWATLPPKPKMDKP